MRFGRFDRKIRFKCPTDKDSSEIIKHYLSSKKVSDNVNMDDISKMISYSSCAELETILNEAAITAAYEKKQSIEMEDIVKSVLRMQYDSPDNYTKTSDENMRKTALHEAGHLVVSEVLCSGSVGLASIRSSGRDSTGGFIHRCKELSGSPYHVLVSLAGKAAVELYFSDTCASGCAKDIERAFTFIRDGISDNASLGMGLVDVETMDSTVLSESLNSRIEAATHAELERFMFKTREILIKNTELLEKITAALIEKKTQQ